MSAPAPPPAHSPTPSGRDHHAPVHQAHRPFDAPADLPTSVRTAGEDRKFLVGTGVGNALEWYDWNVYASFSVYIAAQLFDSTNPDNKASGFLATLAIFAVGFLARPFGGFVFGWLADRVGRKHSLEMAVIAASVGSLLIAICPTYEQIGLFAPVILLIARLVQGLAHGGELPSAQTYLAERAPAAKRGVYASSIYVTGTIGLLIGMVLALTLSTSLAPEQMNAWGWRVPFAIGAVMGVFALWMRSRLDESEVFTEEKQGHDLRRESVLAGVWRHRKQAAQVIGMTAGLTVSYYVWSVATPSYAIKQLHFSPSDAFWASIIGNVVFIAVLPMWGMVSDRVGRKPVILFAMFAGAVAYLPMTWLIHDQMWQLTVAIVVMLVILAAYLSVAPAAYAEMFPTDVRATAFGLPYAVAIALFGGTAPYVQTWMVQTFHSSVLFPIYAIVLMVASGLTVLTLPETKGSDLSH